MKDKVLIISDSEQEISYVDTSGIMKVYPIGRVIYKNPMKKDFPRFCKVFDVMFRNGAKLICFSNKKNLALCSFGEKEGIDFEEMEKGTHRFKITGIQEKDAKNIQQQLDDIIDSDDFPFEKETSSRVLMRLGIL